METYIPLSLLNDFIFCPRSIYFHHRYEGYDDKVYKDTPQVVGSQKHEAIDDGRYSSKKSLLQATPVFCEELNIGGKIDTFDVESGSLVERKNKVKKIYDGYIYQLHGQYFCLTEMGYKVTSLFIHSLSDNKRYPISIPNQEDKKRFVELLQQMRSFDLHSEDFHQPKSKCQNCIYAPLCDYSSL